MTCIQAEIHICIYTSYEIFSLKQHGAQSSFQHSIHSLHGRLTDRRHKPSIFAICRFRKTNHYLPLKPVDGEILIEKAGTCNCQKLVDEYHYVLECSSLSDKRKQLLPKYFMKRHNVVKFFELLSTKKQSLLRKLCIFIKHQ